MLWNTLSLKVLATCEIWDGSSEGTADMDGMEEGAELTDGDELGMVEGELLGSMDTEGAKEGALLNDGAIEGASLGLKTKMHVWHVSLSFKADHIL